MNTDGERTTPRAHWRMPAIKAHDYDFIYAHAQQLGLTGNNAVADALTALLNMFRADQELKDYHRAVSDMNAAPSRPSGELVELVERERSDSAQP